MTRPQEELEQGVTNTALGGVLRCAVLRKDTMQLSYNKLRTFGECRLKYRLAYVERLPQPPLRALSFHRKLHAALRQYHHFARRDGSVREEELLAAYAHIYEVQRQPEVRESKAYQEGEAILRRYCETENQKKRVPAYLEHALRISFGPYTLVGIVDRLNYTDTPRYSLVDYKLDRLLPRTNMAETSPQLAFYQLLVREGLGLELEDARLYYLRHGVEQVRVCSHSQIKPTVEWIDSTASAIHQEKQWQPTVGEGCRTCAFHKACPKKTGQERPSVGVWQQGNLLWDMKEVEAVPPVASTPTVGNKSAKPAVRQITLDDYL